MKVQQSWTTVWLVFFISCTSLGSKEQIEIERLKEKFSTLKPNQALVKVLIGNQDFYAEEHFFNAEVQLLPQMLKVGFVSEEGSNVEMEMARDNWFEQKPITFTLTNGTLEESSGDQVIVMIGKLIDKMALQGEGYFLVTGRINVPELSHQLISIVFEGNLVKPSQASIVENYIPVKGWILVKEPTFSKQSSTELLRRMRSPQILDLSSWANKRANWPRSWVPAPGSQKY